MSALLSRRLQRLFRKALGKLRRKPVSLHVAAGTEALQVDQSERLRESVSFEQDRA